MRILMLGWEFPPFIAGGLGVACYGLTRALDRLGHRVTFVLPKPVDRSRSSHVRMLSPELLLDAPSPLATVGPTPADPSLVERPLGGQAERSGGFYSLPGFHHARFMGVEASFASPYPGAAAVGSSFFPLSDPADGPAPETVVETGLPGPAASLKFSRHADALARTAALQLAGASPAAGYGMDLIGDAERYARLVVALTRGEPYDVVHAHDWLTYPAGLALARVSGRPLVVHVHSTEFDRSGNNVSQAVYDIERAGMKGADRVVAVSNLTRSICVNRYGVNEDRVDVCYNGIEREEDQPPPGARIESSDKIVLFLGRLTMQKGPEYFIAAAKRVLEKVQNVKFVVAGSGDMAMRMIELAAAMGIGHKVFFTGFLRGKDIERVYRMADCYVMPSVSEPFGIAALEAIRHDVPVILSKTSGASEVLRHVLKVDFWDIDEMANKIIAVLRHSPLSQTLVAHGSFELRRLTWDGAAQNCLESYARALESRRHAASR